MFIKMNFKLRQYQPKDRETLRYICCETGFIGEPIDQIFYDRKIFADMIIGYYLAREPKHTLVAEVEGNIVGYLTGSIANNAQIWVLAFGTSAIIKAAIKSVLGFYKTHSQNKKFIKNIFKLAFSGLPDHPKNAAHCHLNLLKGYRGKGIGTALLKTFYKQARKAEFTKVFEDVTSHPGKTLKYFKQAGFTIFDEKPGTLFGDKLKGKASSICIVKSLDF